ncbi:MAG: hypothetical protein RL414_1194 [Actinomycetota bacterium]
MLSVFVVPEITSDKTLFIEGDEAHHAIKVVRLEVGEEIHITDGAGNWARAAVMAIEKKRFLVEILERGHENELQPELIVIQAMTKSDRVKEALELLVVGGVDRIIPWHSERTLAKWQEDSAEKWGNTIVAAAKQCRRFRFPIIGDPMSTSEIANQFGKELLVLHEGASAPISQSLNPGAQRIIVLVGPEGGISDAELHILTESGGRPVRLGNEVLRSAHAGFAALSAIQALIGRW